MEKSLGQNSELKYHLGGLDRTLAPERLGQCMMQSTARYMNSSLERVHCRSPVRAARIRPTLSGTLKHNYQSVGRIAWHIHVSTTIKEHVLKVIFAAGLLQNG